MEKIILRKSGNEQQPDVIEKKLIKDKIKHFHQQIIECYESQIKESYWGNEDDFIDLVEQGDKSAEEDSVNITCKNGQEIKFPRLLFDFLFKEDIVCTFGHPIGQRYEYGDYIFMELIESPIVTINKSIEKSGVFPITRDEKGNIESCFFIKSWKQGENYDYSNEIIPFFVSQMRVRLKTFRDTLPSYFIDHFEPIKYVLKIKRGQENLLIKLLYKLGANLGIIENGVMEDQKISIQQEIRSIIDDENNVNLTNEPEENLNSLNFYLSAIRNTNPYYRFLDAYHALESLFYKHFYNYVKKLDDSMTKDELYNKIKGHLNEQQMLKLVLVDCFDNQYFIESIKNSLIKIKIQELGEVIRKDYDVDCNKWPVNDAEKFASNLSDLIYTFRNAIAHSKESDRHIEKIEESPNLISDFIDLTNTILDIAKHVLEKNVKKW